MGLRIMRYRAKMIGASIDVRPNEAGGTIVTCRYRPTEDRNTKATHGRN
jgi:nitrate/nitrite-specific signal transduction histidine kinase